MIEREPGVAAVLITSAICLGVICAFLFVLWQLVTLPMWVWLLIGGIVAAIVLAVRQ